MQAIFAYAFPKIRLPGGAAVFLTALFAMLGFPHAAFAQITLGDVFCNVYQNLGPFVDLMNGIAYVSGAILLGQGVLHLRGTSEDPRNKPIHQGLARLGGGAALLAVPYFGEKMVETFFFAPGGAGLMSCDVIVGQSGGIGNGNGVGLDVLITNLVDNIEQPLISLLSILSIVIGVYLLVRGLHKASKYGTDPKAYSVPTIATSLIIGTVLIVVGQSLETMLTTLFGDPNIASSSILSWSTLDSLTGGVSDQFKTAVYAALTFFQLIGMIAFLRGWLIVKNAIEGTGQATLAQGFTHIIGGVFAINIYGIISMFDATFGTYLFS